MNSEILFHTETGGNPPNESSWSHLRFWIEAVISERGGKTGTINYIFCGDDYLHKMNVEYLNHDTLTDIITFPYDAFPLITGDMFISTERVADNAQDLNIDFTDELHRVIIHGILHLCGQGDKTEEQAAEMRALEEWALGVRPDSMTGQA